MARWTLVRPQTVEDFNNRFILKGSRIKGFIVILAYLLILLLVAIVIGISIDTIGGIIALAVLAILSLALFILKPLGTSMEIDGIERKLSVINEHAFGLAQWPRRRETSFNSSEITRVELKSDMMGATHFVHITTASGDAIYLQYGNKEEEARQMGNRLATTFVQSGITIEMANHLATTTGQTGITVEGVEEEPEAPFETWRFMLAGIYGLTVALGLGHLWALIVEGTQSKYALAAIFLGLIVGAVVSVAAAGSKDTRFSILGAVLAGISIAFGELLIFGLPKSQFVYQFDVTDLLFYGFAVYEGWVIPRRSISWVRRISQIVSEDNRTPVMLVGLAGLLLMVWISGTTGRLPTPDSALAKYHFDQATLLVEESRFTESIDEYQEAIRIQPDYALAHNDLGTVYYELGRFAEAEVSFKTAVESDPDLAVAHINLANIFDDLGLYEEGMQEVQIGIDLDPEMAEGHLVLGFLLGSQGNFEESLQAFEKSIDLDPTLLDAYVYSGLIHAELGQYTQSVEFFSRVLNTEMDLDPSGLSIIYYFRGSIYAEMREDTAAIADLEKAIEIGMDPAFEFDAQTLLETLGD